MGLVTDDRASNGPAPLLLGRIGLVQTLLFDEEVSRRDAGAGEVAERAPPKGVAALLGHRVDDPGRAATVLRVELVGDDLEFLDRLEGRARLCPGAAAAHVVVVVA